MAREMTQRMRSLAGEMRRAGGRLRGAAALRGWLVLAVVAIQSFEVSQYYAALASSPLWIVVSFATPMLFAAAGVTLAHSAGERDWRAFVTRRAARTLPLLVAAVLISAFLVGPVATQASPDSYFGDAQTYLFLLNAIGLDQPGLPQTFEFANAAGVVNAPFWTIPYFGIGMAMLAATARFPRYSLAVLLAVAALLVAGAIVQATAEPFIPRDALYRATAGQGLSALFCFVLGSLARHQAERVKIDGRFALGAIGILGLSGVILPRDTAENGLALALISIPATYLIVYLLTRRPIGQFLDVVPGTFWTGLFLIAFPVQQLVMQAIGFDRSPLLNLLLALPPAILLAWGAAKGVHRWVLPRVAAASDFDRLARERQGAPRERRSVSSHARRVARQVPALLTGLTLLALALAVFALLFLAAQRENPGI